MKKILNFIVNNYVPILLIIIFVLAGSYMNCENDLFFDLKTGEDILKNGLTFKEHFCFIPGLTYVYLHWFYDVFIYLIYCISSWNGLFIFFTCMSGLFFVVFYNEIYKLKKDKLISLIITIFTFLICKYAFVSRVQTITYLLLFLEVLSLEKLYKTGKVKYSIYLVLLSILVVNLQMPIWIFYLILTLPFVVEAIMSKIFKNKFEECYNFKTFIITILLLICSGLVSPYGLIPYTYCLKSLGNPIYRIINLGEMKSTTPIIIRPLLIISLSYVVGSYFKVIKLSLRDFCLVCGLILFSLIVNKNVIFFLYFGPYILIKNINIDIIKKYLEKCYSKINISHIEIILIIVCSIITLKVFSFKYNYFDKYGYEGYPLGIVNYLKENTDYKNIKLFTNYNTGSYYLFNDLKVFVDSRAEVYMKEYNGKEDILYDYNKTKSYSTYKEILDKYDFDYFAIDGGDEIYDFLLKENGYCIVDRYKEYFLFEHYKEKNVIKRR